MLSVRSIEDKLKARLIKFHNNVSNLYIFTYAISFLHLTILIIVYLNRTIAKNKMHQDYDPL